MGSVLAVELFGRELPSLPAGGIGLVVLIFIVAIFIASRGSGLGESAGSDSRRGHGRFVRCERCSRDFQPEQVELLGNGDVRRSIDKECPGCGWGMDWGHPKD